jgi:hypothetical protein
VWQGPAGNRCPYADQVGLPECDLKAVGLIKAARQINGDADSGTEKKRMLSCNRADRGCVAFWGQYHLAGNGADFSVVLKLENV